MTVLSNNFESLNNIAVLFRKDLMWHYKDEIQDLCLEIKDNINKFLSENSQFVQINDDNIINLNHLEDYYINRKHAYCIIFETKYIISSRFIPSVRTALRKFQNNRNTALLPSSTKGAWLKHNQSDKSLITLIDVENIRYMLRKGSQTYVHYKNKKNRIFYETLKYFEANLDSSLPLIRIDRNCIINIKYISSYKIDSKKKIGEIRFDDQLFKISRRNLVMFKMKIKKSGLIFLMQKFIE